MFSVRDVRDVKRLYLSGTSSREADGGIELILFLCLPYAVHLHIGPRNCYHYRHPREPTTIELPIRALL